MLTEAALFRGELFGSLRISALAGWLEKGDVR
jgi:hypothetical protein